MLSSLTTADIPNLALGCSVLGSGGGGDTAVGTVWLRNVLPPSAELQLLSPETGRERDGHCVLVGAVGAPTILAERLPSGREIAAAIASLQETVNTEFTAVAPIEIGGINGVVAAVAAAQLHLPLLDADGMGRAFPRIDQIQTLGAAPLTPLALSEATGATVVISDLDDARVHDAVVSILPTLGGWAMLCLQPMPVSQMAVHAVPHSVTKAVAMGRQLRERWATHDGSYQEGKESTTDTIATLFVGVVQEVMRRSQHGGVATLSASDGTVLRLDFETEYVRATCDGDVIARFPTVIATIDDTQHKVVSTALLRQGQRLRVVHVPVG